jgi:hypothetical protein
MQNSGIFLRKMIEIVAEGDTFILHFAFFILHFYRAIGSINWDWTVKNYAFVDVTA